MKTYEQVIDYINAIPNLELCYFDVGNKSNGYHVPESKKTDYVERIILPDGTWYIWFRA